MTTDNTALAHNAPADAGTVSPVKDETVQPENHARAFSKIQRQDQATPNESTTAVHTGPKSRINPDDHRFVRLITIGVAFAGLVAFPFHHEGDGVVRTVHALNRPAYVK